VIEYVEGVVERVEPEGRVVLSVGPLALTLSTPPSPVPKVEAGAFARFYTHLAVGGDRFGGAESLILYGFKEEVERDLFALLITASGVGPRTALAALAIGAREIAGAIRSENAQALTAVPGIGSKTAQKIVLELKDKVVQKFGDLVPASAASPLDVDAADALRSLGYTAREAARTLASIRPRVKPGATLEEVLRLALTELKS